ncbi:DUF6089 family protein [Ferruginibacter sp. SUN002]|uniref:DUF6089 family protein n=1 Tax=Ferruginibacter sp. SUN002 TaxID=2937789 RepID=UPI003D366336
MKANEKPLLMLMAVMALSIFQTKAQLLSNMSIGVNAGAYIYQGDLTPSFAGSIKTPSAGFSLYAQKAFSDYLSFRLNFSAAKLRADESKYNNAFRQQRAFSFSTPLKELSGLVVWNLKGSNFNNYGKSPYLFTGIGFSFLNVSQDYSRVDTAALKDPTLLTNISRDVAHGTPKVLPVIPIGVGMDFPLSQRLFLSTEAAYRFSFSDYIDGFSLSANPYRKDSYYSVSVGLKYRFYDGDDSGGKKNNKSGCPANVY